MSLMTFGIVKRNVLFVEAVARPNEIGLNCLGIPYEEMFEKDPWLLLWYG